MLNKKNLKILLIISAIAVLFNFAIIDNAVFALTTEEAAKQLAGDSPIKDPADIFRILQKITQYVYTVFFVVAIIYIIFAAFNFLTAGGDTKKVETAQSQIFWAVIAIAIALISVAAAQIILSFLAKS